MQTPTTTARNAAMHLASDELIRTAGAAATLRRIASELTGPEADELAALAVGMDGAHYNLRAVYEHLECS